MRMPDNYTLSDVLFNRSAGDLAPAAPVDPALVFGPQRDSLLIVIPITIMYTAIFVMGLLGNVFTCIVIIRNKSMHTATNYYLFSLAISDLLLLVSGMPQEMYSIWYKWPYVFGSAFCLMRGLAAETSTNASILTITLFTVERYLAICHPFQSHKMSKLSRATKHVVLLWVVSFTLALPQALQFGIWTHIGVVMCLQTRVIIEHSFEISTFVFFLTPIVVITVLYFLIGLRLNETNRGRVHKDFESGEVRSMNKMSKRHSQSTRRVVKMLVAVVVAFFICWAPFHAQRLVAIYGTNENHLARSPNLLFVYSILTYTSGVFYYVSTCINPILYHIMCSKFRVAFKNTVVWCCRVCGARGARGAGAPLVFARVPTSSGGSVHSGNIPARNETTSFRQKAPDVASRPPQSESGKLAYKTKPGPEDPATVQDCGGANYCRHKYRTREAIARWEAENKLNMKIANTDASHAPFWTTLSCSRYNGNGSMSKTQSSVCDTISNSSLKESRTEDLDDELTSYLKEITERVQQCEREYT